MSNSKAIIHIAAICLLVLGGLSGLMLFLRASFGSTKHDEPETGTLWALFAATTIVGLAILFILAYAPQG